VVRFEPAHGSGWIRGLVLARVGCRLPAQGFEAMKLSARNVLPGKVVAVTKGSTTAHVKVELAPGLTVFSSITNEAVDELGLKVGDSVSAVIKSSDVMIGK
jgi:molybdopterin-binding protein